MATLNLKSFHLVFIGAAIALLAGFGAWALLNGHFVGGVLSLVVGAALIVYGAFFAGRTTRIPNIPSDRDRFTRP